MDHREQYPNIFIPKQLMVARHDIDKESFITFRDEKNVIRSEYSYTSLLDRCNSIPATELLIDNVPFSEFEILEHIKSHPYVRYKSKEYVKVKDPRGFISIIDIGNFMYILEFCGIEKNLLISDEIKLVYGWINTNMVLVPVDSPMYTAAMTYTNSRYSKSLTAKDLKYGDVYINSKGEPLMYVSYDRYLELGGDVHDYGYGYCEYREGIHIAALPYSDRKKKYCFIELSQYIKALKDRGTFDSIGRHYTPYKYISSLARIFPYSITEEDKNVWYDKIIEHISTNIDSRKYGTDKNLPYVSARRAFNKVANVILHNQVSNVEEYITNTIDTYTSIISQPAELRKFKHSDNICDNYIFTLYSNVEDADRRIYATHTVRISPDNVFTGRGITSIELADIISDYYGNKLVPRTLMGGPSLGIVSLFTKIYNVNIATKYYELNNGEFTLIKGGDCLNREERILDTTSNHAYYGASTDDSMLTYFVRYESNYYTASQPSTDTINKFFNRPWMHAIYRDKHIFNYLKSELIRRLSNGTEYYTSLEYIDDVGRAISIGNNNEYYPDNGNN